MKTNSKVILGILGLSISAQAQTANIGVPMIKREDIQKIAEKYEFPDMEKSLLEAGIIQEVKLHDYYIVYPTKLSEEARLAALENDEYIVEVLKSIKKERLVIKLKDYNRMMSTSQDFSPHVKIDQIKTNDRFRRGGP